MKPVIFHAAAKAELAEAMDWYEKQVRELGEDLEQQVENAVRKIQENPQSCSPHKHTGLRKRRIRRFPYIIFFLELEDSLWIVAVAHTRRRPEYWKKRLSE